MKRRKKGISTIGGPLGLVRDGDLIELNADRRELNLLVDEEELARRREAQPAHLGMDFDFLRHESLVD